MALHTLLAIAAGLSMGPGQDPSIDTQIVAPILSRVATTAVTATDTVSDEKVSAHFRDAKPSDVLMWLEQHGVNFVASGGEIPKDTLITLNIDGQPIGNVVDAIGKALGGHWERDNGIYVFRRGASWNTFPQADAFPKGNFTPFPQTGKMPAFPALPKMPEMKAWKDGKPMSKEEWEKTFGPDFQKKMEAWSKEFEKSFGPEYQKKMEDWSKQFQKEFTPEKMKELRADGKTFYLAPGNAYKFDKGSGILKLDKDGVYQLDRDKLEKFKGDGKAFYFAPGNAYKLQEGGVLKLDKDGVYQLDKDKVLKLKKEDIEKFQKNGPKVRIETFKDGSAKLFKDGKPYMFDWTPGKNEGMHSFGFGPNLDIEQFMKDLTTNQRDMQSKRGYIRYSDLTPAQQKKLGDRPDGKFEITFKVNGEQITIRND